jgi:hypothetical protein
MNPAAGPLHGRPHPAVRRRETLDPALLDEVPEFKRAGWSGSWSYRPDLAELVSRWETPGDGRSPAALPAARAPDESLLRRMLDETEFLSDLRGPRALAPSPRAALRVPRRRHRPTRVRYQPAESDSTGSSAATPTGAAPIWLPVNYLLIESLQKFHHYYGDDFVAKLLAPRRKPNCAALGPAATTREMNESRACLKGSELIHD